MISPFAQHEIRISTSPAHSPFSSLSLPVGEHAKSIGKNRPFTRLPPSAFKKLSELQEVIFFEYFILLQDSRKMETLI